MTTDVVACPVCKGTKKALAGDGQCLCCKGEGQITKERDAVLRRIRTDLTARLRERFPDDPFFQ